MGRQKHGDPEYEAAMKKALTAHRSGERAAAILFTLVALYELTKATPDLARDIKHLGQLLLHSKEPK